MNTKQIDELIFSSLTALDELYKKLDKISLFNQEKVLNAFRKNKVAARHFNGSTGYGYDDDGRDNLKRVFKDVFNAEACLVSPLITSGTHALALALYSVLKRGDKALAVTGMPYDTLEKVIFKGDMSLISEGVDFKVMPFNGEFDYSKILESVKKGLDLIYVQRSRGYEEREAISVYKIKELCDFLRSNGFNGIIFVDNCYGEFTEDKEPIEVGADIAVGSLIKNIGGGLAPTGGYIVGKHSLIERCEARMTAPSLGGEVGSYASGYQYFYQGLFLAPHVVAQSLKGSLLLGVIMEKLGYRTVPKAYAMPYDITRSVCLGSEEKLVSFIQSVQYASPVDSFVNVEPCNMPGYQNKVVMAAGCFVQGASIELSADAPIKKPYNAYIQGGLTMEHWLIALKEILKSL